MGYVLSATKLRKILPCRVKCTANFWARGRKCHTLRYGAKFGVRLPECPQCVILRSVSKILSLWHIVFLGNYVFRKCIFNSVSTDGKIVRFIRSNTNIPRRINTNVCCRSISYSLCKCSFRNTYGKNNSINEKDKMKIKI